MTRLSPVRALRKNSVALAFAAAALTMIAAGCGSSSKTSSATTAAAGAATTAAPAATTAAPTATTAAATATTAAAGGGGAGTTVTAMESEFKIALDTTTFKPGSYTFNSTNKGSFKHNITIDGPGASDVTTGNIDPGKSGTVTVTLAAGTYEIYCSIPTHKDKGMDMTITVA